MQRIMNDPDYIVDEMVEGFLKNHKDLVEKTANPRVLKSRFPTEGRVAVVTGGGSGHKPAFIGYCGENLCDAVAIGEICSSPTAMAFCDAFKAVDSGNGAPNDQREKRRGVAGEVLMWKVGGAKAATGASLDEVIAAAQKAIDQTRSVGIGLSPCTLPAVGHPNFEIKEGTMEVGIGHHGEPGIEVCPLESAAEMAERMLNVVLPDLPFAAGDDTVVLVSGLGATPVMELYVLYNEIEKRMIEKEIHIHRSYVGNYFTSLDMMGATLTVMKLDDELKDLIDMPCASMGLTQK